MIELLIFLEHLRPESSGDEGRAPEEMKLKSRIKTCTRAICSPRIVTCPRRTRLLIRTAIFLIELSRYLWYDLFIPEKEVVRCVKGSKKDDILTSRVGARG